MATRDWSKVDWTNNEDNNANASTAQVSYTNAINLIRASGLVRAACNRGELFLIRNDI